MLKVPLIKYVGSEIMSISSSILKCDVCHFKCELCHCVTCVCPIFYLTKNLSWKNKIDCPNCPFYWLVRPSFALKFLFRFHNICRRRENFFHFFVTCLTIHMCIIKICHLKFYYCYTSNSSTYSRRYSRVHNNST